MKVGLIGLRGHHSTVLKGAEQMRDVEIVAISAGDSGRRSDAESLQRKLPYAKNAIVYDDWRRMLDHSLLDVCVLGDENGVRAEQLLALMQLGVHIISEKPLTTSLDDLSRVREGLARSKSRLTMLLTMRHDAKYAEARRIVGTGALGEISIATVQKSYRLGNREEWFKHRSRLGGTIPFIGIHAIDLIRWIAGVEFRKVAAFHGQLGMQSRMGETESHASVLLQMTNGGSATVRLDYLRPETADTHADDRLRIAGTKGVLELESKSSTVRLITAEKGVEEIASSQASNLFVDFAAALKEGRPSRIPQEDCLRMTEIVLKAREAADSGRIVDL